MWCIVKSFHHKNIPILQKAGDTLITLKNSSQPGVTLLSNLFIDHYMPEANGEFVKVYIYLLRTISNAPVSFSLEQMADHLLCTEKDVLRALKYWDKAGFLSLSYDEEKHLSGIILQTPDAPERTGKVKAAPVPQSVSKTAPEVSSEKTPDSKPTPASLTPDRIKELKQNEEIVQLLYIAEQYLGKTLTSTEMQKILYFYDELKMSSVLIEFLIEYCVGRNHRSIRYMESVALEWARTGITTVEEAKATTSLYGKDYFTILKFLGITGRNPISDEITFMDTWMKTYGFTMEIIREACNRTILKTGQPSFQYADSILADWKKHDVHSLKDVQVLDAQYKKSRPASEKPPKQQKTASAPNRFNNFTQRDYDFKAYEKKFFNQ